MDEGPRLRGLPVFGFAVAGLLIGHAISYAIAVPDPHHRDLVLQQTGHGYLSQLAEVAMILALAGIAAVVVRSLATRRLGMTERFTDLARLLIGVQMAAFLGQEVLERLVAGAPLGGLAQDHLLGIGLLMQFGIATLAAFLLWLVGRASARIAQVVAPPADPPRDGPGPAVPVDRTYLPRILLASTANVRGPPLS